MKIENIEDPEFLPRMEQAMRLIEILIKGHHPCKVSDKLWDIAIRNLEQIVSPPVIISNANTNN